jgi:hypothetical protein
MATKLGEMLVETGSLTPIQLEEALKSQVIFGGRLGTNLIEMGYMDEDDLAAFLSKKMSIPCVTSEQMAQIPKDVITLIPKELARKYQIMPLALVKKRLTLAMLDPSDLALLDEISFVTGYVIVPRITPEVMLVLALEKYYGIRPDKRFVQFVETTRGRTKKKTSPARGDKTKSAPPPVDAPKKTKEENIDVIDQMLPPEATDKTGQARIEPAMAKVVAIDSFVVEPVAVEQALREPAAPVTGPEPASEATPAAVEAVKSVAETFEERLSEARDREDIADILVSRFDREFDRVVLFMIKGKTTLRWRALRNGQPIDAEPEPGISLKAPSLLKVVTDGKSYFLGAIPDSAENREVIHALGGAPPSSALLVPLTLMGRVVAVLFVEGGKEPLVSRIADLQKIMGKAAMAFEILILKNKILMT